MQYSTFYAKLTPNGAVNGTRYSISITGITWEGTSGLVTYSGTPLYFTIKPKSSGLATVTFKNETTGDIIGSKQILVRSTTLAKPTYSLAASATSVNEGGSVNFTLDTSDVPQTTNVPYTITGVSVDDISLNSLKGNFTIGADGKSVLPISIVADELTEGTETLTVTLDQVAGLSKSVTINDTSLTPTFDVGWYGTATGTGNKLTTIEEGHAPYIVVKTTNIPDGTVLTYEVTGDGIDIYDFGETPLTGNISITNNRGYFLYRSVIDRLTEGNETATATVRYNGNIVGTATIIIQDTSKATTYNIGIYESTTSTTEITSLTPITGGSFTIRVGQGIDPLTNVTTYGLSTFENSTVGSLIQNELYIDGVKLTPVYADVRYNPKRPDLDTNLIFFELLPVMQILNRRFRVKMTNLDNGKVGYTVIVDDTVINSTAILLMTTVDTLSRLLADIFIVNNRVKFEIEWQ